MLPGIDDRSGTGAVTVGLWMPGQRAESIGSSRGSEGSEGGTGWRGIPGTDRVAALSTESICCCGHAPTAQGTELKLTSRKAAIPKSRGCSGKQQSLSYALAMGGRKVGFS